MISISTTFHARFRGEYALQLLQTASIKNSVSNREFDVFAKVGVTAAGTNGGAIDSIMRIIMDAKGNAGVLIDSPDGTASVNTGNGNDTVAISAATVNKLSTHGGDDTITIKTSGHKAPGNLFDPAVYMVDAGHGNDAIAIDSNGDVVQVDGNNGDDDISITATAPIRQGDSSFDNLLRGIAYTSGGSGNDKITLQSATSALNTDAGDGDDIISIATKAFASNTDGGNGDDAIRVTSRNVDNVYGGEGNDIIEVTGINAMNIQGGGGNDIISVTSAAALYNISGGKGDDYVVLNSTSTVQSTYHFAQGDGHDIIETNNPLEIMPFSDDGTRRGDMMNAIIEKQGNTLRIGFTDSTDTITINLSGRMAEAENIRFTYNSHTQSLLIADDQFFIDNPPGQTVFVRPEVTK